MIKKIRLILVITIRLAFYLAFTRRLEYSQIVQKIKSSKIYPINTKSEADLAFKYISFLCRRFNLNNPCVVVSVMMFESSPPGGVIHFGVDSKQGIAHSWYEWNGVNYTTDRFFEGSVIESISK